MHFDISCKKKGKSVEIIIDDDGPGIPIKEREKVLHPFYRISASKHILKNYKSYFAFFIADSYTPTEGKNPLITRNQKTFLMIKNLHQKIIFLKEEH